MGMTPLIGGIIDTLQELVIDEVTLEKILESLKKSHDTMPGKGEFGEPNEQIFGNLPSGVEMGTHTTGAHDYLFASMVEMMQTLGAYSAGVRSFREGANNADEFTTAQLSRINRTIEHGRRTNRNQDEGERG